MLVGIGDKRYEHIACLPFSDLKVALWPGTMSPLEYLMKDMVYTQHRNTPNILHKIKRVHGHPKPNHRAQFTNFCSEVSG